MAARTTRSKKFEHQNVTQGYLGVTILNRKGDETAVPVEPGDRIFLTQEEIDLTEQSYKRRERSPFHPREIQHRDPHTGDVIKTFVSAPLARPEALAA